MKDIIQYAQSLDDSIESAEALYVFLIERFCLSRPAPPRGEKKGILITFDGHSGAGKDTQIRRLAGHLGQSRLARGRDVAVLVQKRADPFRAAVKRYWAEPAAFVGPDPSFRLLSAGRRYFLESALLGRLADPRALVLQNRSYLSTAAYAARNVGELGGMLALCRLDPAADLAFVLSCPTQEAFARIRRRSPQKGGIIYPNERPEYIDRVKANFAALARRAAGLVAVDTAAEEEAVAREVARHVDRLLESRPQP